MKKKLLIIQRAILTGKLDKESCEKLLARTLGVIESHIDGGGSLGSLYMYWFKNGLKLVMWEGADGTFKLELMGARKILATV